MHSSYIVILCFVDGIQFPHVCQCMPINVAVMLTYMYTEESNLYLPVGSELSKLFIRFADRYLGFKLSCDQFLLYTLPMHDPYCLCGRQSA